MPVTWRSSQTQSQPTEPRFKIGPFAHDGDSVMSPSSPKQCHFPCPHSSDVTTRQRRFQIFPLWDGFSIKKHFPFSGDATCRNRRKERDSFLFRFQPKTAPCGRGLSRKQENSTNRKRGLYRVGSQRNTGKSWEASKRAPRNDSAISTKRRSGPALFRGGAKNGDGQTCDGIYVVTDIVCRVSGRG